MYDDVCEMIAATPGGDGVDINNLCCVNQLVAEMNTAFQAWRQAFQASSNVRQQNEELLQAYNECRASRHPDVVSLSGDKLRQYLADYQVVYQRLDIARKACTENVQQAHAKCADLAHSQAELKVLLEKTGDVVDSARLKAARQLASAMLAKTEEIYPADLLAATEACIVTAVDNAKENRKVAPLKQKYQPMLKALADAVERLILVHEKALAAMTEAKEALSVVEELSTSKIIEPQKPTSEEVSRYINDLRSWAEANLPAERAAAKSIYAVRQYQATLERDLKLAQIAYDKVVYLSARAVDYDVDALIRGAGELITEITKVSRGWRFLCNTWVDRKLEKSEAVTDIKPDEQEAIEQLQQRIKDISTAVAIKCNAHLKYDGVANKNSYNYFDLVRALHDLPNFYKLDGSLELVDEVLIKNEKAQAANERKHIERDLAWDNYQSRLEFAREATKDAMKLASRLQKVLLAPRADQLRIELNIVSKLHALHAVVSYYLPMASGFNSSKGFF